MKELVLILALTALAGCASKGDEYKPAPAPAQSQQQAKAKSVYLVREAVTSRSEAGPFKTQAECDAAIKTYGNTLGLKCVAK